jgi:hypothetical protein
LLKLRKNKAPTGKTIVHMAETQYARQTHRISQSLRSIS